MFTWCIVSVVLNHSWVETAAKGKILHESGSSYVVDFSEYAKKQGYDGEYSMYPISKDKCTNEKD